MSFKYWYYILYPSTWYCTIVVYMYLSAQLHRTAVPPVPTDAGTCVGAVPAVQRAPPAHAPQRAPPRSQRVTAWRVAASLPYGALPAVRAPRRASSRPPPSWRPPAPRESCAARAAARARRPSSRPHRTRTSRAQRARAARARRPSRAVLIVPATPARPPLLDFCASAVEVFQSNVEALGVSEPECGQTDNTTLQTSDAF